MKQVLGFIILVTAFFIWVKSKQKLQMEEEAEAIIKDNTILSNSSGYETLDTPKYGRITFQPSTYQELISAATAIANDLRVAGGHWNAMWAYQLCHDLRDDRKVWYLGHLIASILGNNFLQQARRENWAAGSWFDVAYKKEITHLGQSFIARMEKVGWK